jgi:hypothetical protein
MKQWLSTFTAALCAGMIVLFTWSYLDSQQRTADRARLDWERRAEQYLSTLAVLSNETRSSTTAYTERIAAATLARVAALARVHAEKAPKGVDAVALNAALADAEGIIQKVERGN